MNRLARIGLVLLLAGGGVAQARGYARGGYGFHGGYRGYGVHRGYGFHHGSFGYGYNAFYGRRAFGFRYGYPFFTGSYYVPFAPFPSDYSDYYPYPAAPAVTVVYPPPPPQSYAPVVITQQIPPPAPPVVREYRVYRPAEPESRPALYLIAFNDGVIRAAVAYWIDRQTLHYVTREREHRQATLESVDRSFTQRLNRERGMTFSFVTVE